MEFVSPLIALPLIDRNFSNRPVWVTWCNIFLTCTFAIGGGIAQKAAWTAENESWQKAVLALQLIGAIPAIVVSSYLYAWATELYPTPGIVLEQ